MRRVQFPRMRDEVIAALRSLSDRRHQDLQWGVYDPDVTYYDDLALVVHVLYDDCQVLPDPASSVGAVLLPEEVEPLRRLSDVLDPILDELRDRPDVDYLAHDQWKDVEGAACEVLIAMQEAENEIP